MSLTLCPATDKNQEVALVLTEESLMTGMAVYCSRRSNGIGRARAGALVVLDGGRSG